MGNIEFCEDKNMWEIHAEGEYGENGNGCIYRRIEQDDYLSIRIDFQQYTEPWAAINIFISDDEGNVLLNDLDYIFRYGKFMYNGINLYQKGKKITIKDDMIVNPYQIVVNKKKDIVEFYAGQEKPRLVAATQYGFKNKDYFVGVQVKHNNNTFYPWLFSNYIQINGNVYNCDRKVEFFYGLNKHWDCNCFNYFLDINKFKVNEMIHFDFIKIVKGCINSNKYLEVLLDQYFVEGRDEYRLNRFIHQNIVYEYNDRDKKFYLVGYDNEGRIVKTKITYRDFKASMIKNQNEDIKVIAYKQDGYTYRFDLQYVITMIKEYICGKNSSEVLQHLHTTINRNYGMSLYKELKTKRGIEILISDRRVAHLLWEHKKIMVLRVQYLIHCGFLESSIGNDIYIKINSVCDKMFDLKNVLLKYELRPDKIDDNYIKKCLDNIYCIEKSCLEQLVLYLEYNV